MRDHLLIHVNGQPHRVAGAMAFQSLSNFLRYDLGLIGTKVVCAEGDCGSCTVLLGRVENGDENPLPLPVPGERAGERGQSRRRSPAREACSAA
ncbi:MAG: 2Fe-2S iron-sulfur cluster-binding protein, partial [Tepidisphaeraceae bacterium]